MTKHTDQNLRVVKTRQTLLDALIAASDWIDAQIGIPRTDIQSKLQRAIAEATERVVLTNTNCLEGIRCPACGQEDRFKITALITCVVTDDGSEPEGDHDWDDDSSTQCPECGFDGTLKSFRKRNRLPPDPENMNGSRVKWAGVAMRAFMEATMTDEEDSLGDLLANLMHSYD